MQLALRVMAGAAGLLLLAPSPRLVAEQPGGDGAMEWTGTKCG